MHLKHTHCKSTKLQKKKVFKWQTSPGTTDHLVAHALANRKLYTWKSSTLVLKVLNSRSSSSHWIQPGLGKDSDAGRDWGQEEKGTTKDKMVGWHHRLNGHGFGWISGVGDGQGGLACCSSWGLQSQQQKLGLGRGISKSDLC